MIVLRQQTRTVDMSNPVLILNYTSKKDTVAVIRVDLKGVDGTADYFISVYLNGYRLVPDLELPVESGGNVTFQGRAIGLLKDDELTVNAQGTPNDLEVQAVATLFDTTPVSSEDITDVIGPKIISVLHSALKNVVVQIDPTRTVLGPCQPRTTQMPRVQR